MRSPGMQVRITEQPDHLPALQLRVPAQPPSVQAPFSPEMQSATFSTDELDGTVLGVPKSWAGKKRYRKSRMEKMIMSA